MVDEKYAVSYNNPRRWMNLILIKTCKNGGINVEKRSLRPFHRLIALLLRLSLLAPAYVVPAYAAEDTAAAEETPTVSEEVIREVESAVTENLAANTISLPSYATTNGKVSNSLSYDCGNGIARNGATSAIRIVTNTSATEFSNYQTKL